MDELTKQQCRDMKVLITFVTAYCRAKHAGNPTVRVELPPELSASYPRGLELCADCAGLVPHAVEKRRRCPLDPKPSCKKCHVHCYSRQYRERIREIMAFSGRRLIMRGRIHYLWHYFF
jgi:hypothetical protein